MTKVYDQHDTHFRSVSAFVIAKDGERIGTVAFRFQSNSGRVYCYAQVFSSEMARGYAGGGGYDKTTASAEAAFANIKMKTASDPDSAALVAEVKAAMMVGNGGGTNWDRRLTDAGFKVWSAV